MSISHVFAANTLANSSRSSTRVAPQVWAIGLCSNLNIFCENEMDILSTSENSSSKVFLVMNYPNLYVSLKKNQMSRAQTRSEDRRSKYLQPFYWWVPIFHNCVNVSLKLEIIFEFLQYWAPTRRHNMGLLVKLLAPELTNKLSCI